jgi:hypothetical protein
LVDHKRNINMKGLSRRFQHRLENHYLPSKHHCTSHTNSIRKAHMPGFFLI